MTFVYTLNFIDQGLMTLLLQPIKEDLRLSDTQLGFLTGIAFGLFYATLGLPIARLADRSNRVTITAIAIGLWSATVMSCLFVTNFIQLVFARVAAAVGESGCMPPTYSLLGDYFPAPAERTRAMTIYMLASPMSGMISFVLGGWLNEHYGWRFTFFVMGLPGLLAAAVVKTTIAEPRIQEGRLRTPIIKYPGVVKVLGGLWHQHSFRHLSIALILLYTMGSGLGPWYAAFMMRSHGMGTSELGVWLGLIGGLGGLAGVLLGGYLANRWFIGNERGQMRMSAVTVVSLVPFFVAFLTLRQKLDALVAFIPLMIVLGVFVGPTFALMQRLVVDESRATALAAVMLLANLIGMGVGPEIVGVLSDWLRPKAGTDSLRYAMLITSLLTVWAAYHFWKVGQTVERDLLAVSKCTESTANQSGLGGRVIPSVL